MSYIPGWEAFLEVEAVRRRDKFFAARGLLAAG